MPDELSGQYTRNYLEVTGQARLQWRESKAIFKHRSRRGGSTLNWLNMLYPPSAAGSNALLREDGLIAQFSLVLMGESRAPELAAKSWTDILGSENFITTVIWQEKYSPSNDAKWLSDNHDYIVVPAVAF